VLSEMANYWNKRGMADHLCHLARARARTSTHSIPSCTPYADVDSASTRRSPSFGRTVRRVRQLRRLLANVRAGCWFGVSLILQCQTCWRVTGLLLRVFVFRRSVGLRIPAFPGSWMMFEESPLYRWPRLWSRRRRHAQVGLKALRRHGCAIRSPCGHCRNPTVRANRYIGGRRLNAS